MFTILKIANQKQVKVLIMRMPITTRSL